MKNQFFRRVVIAAILGVMPVACTEKEEKPVEIQLVTSPPAQEGACPAELAGGLAKTGPDAVQFIRVTFFDASQGAPSVTSFLCDRLVAADESGTPFYLRFPRETYLHVRAEAFGVPAVEGDPPPLLASGAADDVRFAVSATPPRIFMPMTERFGCGVGSLAMPRAFHTVTALPGGRALIAGGLKAKTTEDPVVNEQNGLLLTDLIEIYDGKTGRFLQPEVTGDASGIPRAFHTAHLLQGATETQAEILLLGGVGQGAVPAGDGVVFPRDAIQSLRFTPAEDAQPAPAELVSVDFTGETPVVTRSVADYDDWPARVFHAQTTYGSGGPCTVGGALAVDAQGTTYDATSDVELGNPATGAHYTATGYTVLPRLGHTVTAITDATALVWGGNLGQAAPETSVAELLRMSPAPPLSQVMTFDASTSDASDPVSTMFHTATLLPGGDVLIVGGFEVESTIALHPNADLPLVRVRVDASGFAVSTQAADGFEPVGYHATLLLPDGRLLITGGSPEFVAGSPGTPCPSGETSFTCSVAQALFFTPGASFTSAGTLEDAGDGLQSARFGHAMAVLDDGTVIVVGGLHRVDQATLHTLASVEVYNLNTGSVAEDLPLGRAPGELYSSTSACATF